MVLNLILFIGCFVVIWFGAGMIVSAVNKLSHHLNLSSFAISFFVLGILTSLPEASIGFNSVLKNDPEIFAGNLIGGNLVLFFLVIPILAIFGKGIKLSHELNRKNLVLALLVVATPVFFTLDSKVTKGEGLFMVIIYTVLFYFIEKKKGMMENLKDKIIHHPSHFAIDIITIIFGCILIITSSRVVVDLTIYFSEHFHISLFLISLLGLSIGTNLPELSLAARSIMAKKKDVAFGDYIGSAAANTFLFGILTLYYNKPIVLINHFGLTFLLMILGLLLFLYFARSKNEISRGEGLILLIIYALFVIFEAS